jgi:hypothetical protein
MFPSNEDPKTMAAKRIKIRIVRIAAFQMAVFFFPGPPREASKMPHSTLWMGPANIRGTVPKAPQSLTKCLAFHCGRPLPKGKRDIYVCGTAPSNEAQASRAKAPFNKRLPGRAARLAY